MLSQSFMVELQSHASLCSLCLSRVLKHVSLETFPSQPYIFQHMHTSKARWLTIKAGWDLYSF